jgi:hypothetical protein
MGEIKRVTKAEYGELLAARRLLDSLIEHAEKMAAENEALLSA